MFEFQPVTALTISAAAVFGLVLALLGSLKFALARRLDIGEGRIGGLLSGLNLALLPMMIGSGLVIDLFGVRWVLILSAALTAGAIGGLSFRQEYRWVLTCVLLAGLGSAGISTASVVLMPRAFGDLPMGAALNLGCVFIALGALVTPVLTDLLLRVTTFSRLVLLLAGVCLVPAVPALFVAGGALPGRVDPAHLARLGDFAPLWYAAGVFFLYAPLEATVSVWGTTYLRELGESERRSTWVLAGFWALFLGSRLLVAVAGMYGALRDEVWTQVLLVVLPLAAAVALGNLAGTASAASARFCLLVLGFVLGPVFPVLVARLFERLEKDHNNAYGTAYGVVFAAGSLGSLVLAPVVAAFAGRRAVRAAFLIPLVLAILLTLAALVQALT